MAVSLQSLVNKYSVYSNTTLDMLMVYLMVSRFGVDPAELDVLISTIEVDEENSGILQITISSFEQTIPSENLVIQLISRIMSVSDATTTSESISITKV